LFLKFPVVYLPTVMKDKIIQKAAELFINLGFKSVTMDDIANEMGISKKTIYTHYNNKTELVRETTLAIVENISHGIDCICALDKDPIEELYEIKKFMLLRLKDEKSSPQYQLQKYYPEIYEQLKSKQFEKMQECTKKNLSRGIELGLYRVNMNVEIISRLYFMGITKIKDDTLFPSNLFNRVQLMEDYLEYHLRGIVTEKGLRTLKKFINKN